MSRLQARPSYIVEPKSWDIDLLDYGPLELSTDVLNVTIAGVSTAALQTTGNTSLNSIDGKTPALVSGRQPVDGSGVTQPVSAVSLPLPTGAALESTLSALNTKIPSQIDSRVPITTGVNYGDTLSIATDPGFPMLGINPISFQWVGIAVGDSVPVGTEIGVFSRLVGPIPAGTAIVGKFGIDQTTPGTTNKVTLGADAVAVTNANLDVALSTRASAANQATEIASLSSIDGKLTTGIVISSMPASSSAANVLTSEEDAGYTDGATGQNLTQTPDGRLRVAAAGLVAEVAPGYLDGELRSLSMTTEGRLRVSVVPANTSLEFFREPESLFFSVPMLARDTPYVADVPNNPWGF